MDDWVFMKKHMGFWDPSIVTRRSKLDWSDAINSERYEKAAKSIWAQSLNLYNGLMETIDDFDLGPECLTLFMYETACYHLHLVDRSLNDIVRPPRRQAIVNEIMRELVSALCRDYYNNYATDDIADDEVWSLFISVYNLRQKEYGAVKNEDWFNKANCDYGLHAAEALKLPEDSKHAFALKSALGALEVYSKMLPDIDPIFDLAKKVK
jgi:hypothetical protein